MKKNILLITLFLFVVNQSSFAIQSKAVPTQQLTTSAELFEVIKSGPRQKCYPASQSPLSELSHFIKTCTLKNHGIITPTILSVIKAFLEREGKAGDNTFNTFYEDLSIYLEEKYPFDISMFDNPSCVICIEQPKNPILLSCNHMFCYDCLFEWYTKHNLKREDTYIQCPLCKKRFDDSVISLFISDEHYKEKSDAAMKDHEQREFQMRILQILNLR